MNKKFSWLYHIPIYMISIFILSNILVKTTIWPSALKEPLRENQYAITISKGAWSTKYRYTTKLKQKVFKAVDSLLPPAFIILFAIIARRLIKSSQIFEGKD